MLKHISLQNIRKGLMATALRFPVSFVLSILATGFAIILIWDKGMDVSQEIFLTKCIYTAIIGFFLTTSITLFSEKNNSPSATRVVTQFFALLLVVLCVFISGANQAFYIQSTVLSIMAFLFTFVAPFLRNGDEDEFWKFTYNTLTRISLSILFGIVAFLGIMLAFGALDILLKVKIDPEMPGSIFAFIALFGSPVYALAGIAHVKNTDWHKDEKYPNYVRFLTQYIMLPLVAVYMLILYWYCAGTILTWNWPAGKMIYFTIAFFVPALLSIIFLAPLKDKKEFTWIAKVEKVFFIAALPLMFPYFYAIAVRIIGDDSTNLVNSLVRSGFTMSGGNGLTWQRFYVVLFGVWFLGIAFYRLFGKNTNIKNIVLSGVIILTLFTIGPWSAFSLSHWSQMTRLRYILEKNNLIEDGKMNIPRAMKDTTTSSELYSLVSYIADYGDVNDIRNMLPLQKLTAFDNKNKNKNIRSYEVIDILGLQYTTAPLLNEAKIKFVHIESNDGPVSVAGSEYFIPFSFNRHDNQQMNETFRLSNNTSVTLEELKNSEDTRNLIYVSTSTDLKKVPIDFSQKFTEILTTYPQSSNIVIRPPDNVIVYEGKGFKVTIVIKTISGEIKDDIKYIYSLQGYVFVAPGK